MSLNIGSLVGYLDLDAKGFDKGLDGALGRLGEFAKRGAVAAAQAGQQAGENLGNGWTRGADGKIRDAQGRFVSAGELAAAGVSNGFDKGSSKWAADMRKKAAAAAAVVGTAFAAGLASTMNVEAGNDKLTAQLDLTGADAERAGTVAGNLYAGAWGGSLEEVNTAVGAVMSSISGMRTASQADLEAATATALDFASAFNTDVTGAANTAGLVIRNGLAKDSTEAFDLMTAAYQRVPAAMRDELPAILDEYGTNFRALGFTGQEAFGLLVDAAEKGPIVLDKVGDSLKELTINGVDLAKNGELLKDLGLDAKDMADAIASGGPPAQDALQKISAGILDIESPAERATAAVSFFGTPLEDLSVDQIPAFLKSLSGAGESMEGFEGSAADMSATLNDNASTALTELKRGAELAVVGLGDKLLPAVKDVVDFLADNFGPTLEEVGGFLADNETAVKAVAVALGTAATIVGVVTLATKTWAIAQGALNVVMSANPIGLVVLAIAALVAGLVYAWNNSETFRDVVTGAFDAVKRGVGNAVGFMIDGFRMLLTVWLTVADGIVSGAAKALGWVPGIGDKLKAANQAFDDMKDGILDTLDEAAQAAYGFGEESGSNAAAGLSSRKQAAFNAGQQVADDMGRGVGSGSGTAYSAGSSVGGSAAQGLIDGMKSYQFSVAKQAQLMAIEAGQGMRSGLQVRSPSRVTTWIGRMTGQGLVDGLRAMRPAVAAEMRALADVSALESVASLPVAALPVTATASRAAMSQVTADPVAAPGGGSGMPILQIDKYYEQPGSSPQANAEALAFLARTRKG